MKKKDIITFEDMLVISYHAYLELMSNAILINDDELALICQVQARYFRTLIGKKKIKTFQKADMSIILN
jgi:hypothetical protein